MGGIRGVVGEDRDLGRAGLGVHPDQAAQQPLRRGHVDVARPGHDVHRRAAGRPMGEHRDRLSSARGVDLVHAQQRAGGEDHRMRQATELRLRRRRQREGADPGLLRRHNVHHHAARVGDPSARHVEADPLHRNPALRHPGPRRHVDGHRFAALRPMHEPGPPDRLLQRVPHLRVEAVQRVGQRVGGNPHRARPHPVETLPRVEDRGIPPVAYVVADRTDRLQRGVDVQRGAGQQPAQLRRRRQASTQVELSQHDDERIGTRTRPVDLHSVDGTAHAGRTR